jgi:hypothetical protein
VGAEGEDIDLLENYSNVSEIRGWKTTVKYARSEVEKLL